MPATGVRWVIRVADEHAQPVAGATLSDGPHAPSEEIHGGDLTGEFSALEGVTGSAGLAIIDTASCGPFEVRAEKDGLVAQLPKLWAAPGQRIELDLVLEPKTVLRGRVVSDEGTPISNPSLYSSIHFWESVGDENGEFSIRGTASDPLREYLWVLARGYSPRLLYVEDPTRELVVTLPSEIRVHGRVLDPYGRGVSGIHAQLVGTGIDGGLGERLHGTDADGWFALSWPAGAAADLVFSHKDMDWVPISIALPAAIGDVDVGIVRVARGRPVSGTVARDDGTPLGLGIATLVADSIPLTTAVVRDGAFRFPAVGPGPYSVEVRDCSHMHLTTRFDDVRGGDIDLQVGSWRRHALDLKLIDASGRRLRMPLRARSVTAQSNLEEVAETEGTSVLFWEPGTFHVELRPQGYWPVVLRNVPITGAEITERTVRLRSLDSR